MHNVCDHLNCQPQGWAWGLYCPKRRTSWLSKFGCPIMTPAPNPGSNRTRLDRLGGLLTKGGSERVFTDPPISLCHPPWCPSGEPVGTGVGRSSLEFWFCAFLSNLSQKAGLGDCCFTPWPMAFQKV